MPRGRSGSELARLRESIGKELQGDEAVQLHVLGFIDHAHPSAAELFDDAIVGNGLARDG